MKNILIVLFSLLVFSTVCAQQSKSRVITNFDAAWKFNLGDSKDANKASFNDKAWRSLNLPHDWSIEGANLETAPGAGNMGYFPSGIGWYRKTFDLPSINKNNKVSVEFDGVYMNSEVWINDVLLGKRPYGYASFSYDLTPYLKAKGNVISVRVDNTEQPNSRWYTGTGIYRHVRLITTNQLHFEKWSIFSYTDKVENNKAFVNIEANIQNEMKVLSQGAIVRNVLYDSKNIEVARIESSINVKSNDKASMKQNLIIENPSLWSLESPDLYTLASYILVNGKEVDCVVSTIGIRTIEYDVDKGFLLNGKRVKMKGVNLHHDGGAVGAAVPERIWERRLEILKEGGCNAIRTAHNAPAPEFLALCDKMGFLVMDEAFDEWLAGKRDYSYKIYYADWHEKDLLAMVLRDRNHPSIVMWSIGNEVLDQATIEGAGLAKELIGICKQNDPTRLVTAGNDLIVADNTPATEEYLAAFENEIIGYNYPDRWHERRELVYSIDRHKFPNRRVVATEAGGMGGERGSYIMGKDPNKITASYPSSRVIDTEQRWKFTLLYDYVIGDFMWTGIDYYGESRWPSRGSTSGYLDNCGFKKDGYYFFKSIWTDNPTIHLMPHWNWEGRKGQVIPVVCFTNCDTVELFVNGKSYGEKRLEFPRTGTSGSWNTYAPGKVQTSTANLHLSWDVVYEPGEIVAIGKKDGKKYSERIVTTGKPSKIRLSVDQSTIKADPSDVAHVTVEIQDKDGNIVPTADNLVKFEIEGASIIGVESGNMRDLSSTKAHERKAFNGLCLGIVQAEKTGIIKIKASSEGLEDCEIEINAIK